MLSLADLVLVVVTIAVGTLAVTAVAFGILRLNRRGSLASQLMIVVAAAIAAIALSTIAVVVEMYFSTHDLVVLGWVIGVSSAMSLAAAWATGRVARSSMAGLAESARRIGDGAIVEPGNPGSQEFATLAGQLAETSRRLAAARDEIDRLDAARRQFFAWISHDLRTPLAGIRVSAEALVEGMVADPDEYVRLIRDRADTLDLLVQDLFELSRLQSGSLRLRPELILLLDLVSESVADIDHVAAGRGVRIVQAGVDGHLLWADPRELGRVIVNLLTNAIHHAPPGSEILVSATTTDDDRLVLSVLDHGSGVAAEDLGRIFDVGWRAEAARSPDRGGSAGAGLGLAIVQGIVQAHGGEVTAQNLHPGFRLDVSLPARVEDVQPLGAS